MTTTDQTFVERREGDTWINAVIGAIVAVLLSFTVVGGVVSTLAGGLVAGYLQGSDRSAGAKVGALSGVIAIIPVVGVLLLVFGFLGIGLLGAGSDALFGIGIAGFVLVVVFLFAFVFSVGLSALGGYIGAILADRREPDTAGRNRSTGTDAVDSSIVDPDANR